MLPNMHVINYVLGPLGSTHNSMSFKELYAWKESSRLFHDGEWLWVDSAYPLTPWCIVPYKHLQSLVLANHLFNYLRFVIHGFSLYFYPSDFQTLRFAFSLNMLSDISKDASDQWPPSAN